MTVDFMTLAADAVAASQATKDPDFPLYHVAPPVGRLNDPNGLIRDGDTYHAFFQFSPVHPRKLVYWGHATSTDLTHWSYHAPAIAPDTRMDANGAYSGTAIAVEGGYELWYTANYKDPVTDEREATQCVVTSPDMVHFTKIADNPIIGAQPAGYTAHFRDPQVWLDPDRIGEAAGAYRMLIGVQRADLTGAALLYRSPDLREWSLEGEMTFPGTDVFDNFGYMWECPNLVRLVDEDTGEARDVLILCPQGINPDREGFENIFPCVYIVGELVGTELRGTGGQFHEVDRGFEFYAPQIYARTPAQVAAGEPALLMGWAGNASEDDLPSIGTGNWVHTLTVARSLTLRSGRLIQRPLVPGLPCAPSALSGARMSDEAVRVPELDGSRSWRLVLEVGEDSSPSWTISIGHSTKVSFLIDEGVVTVDRTNSRYPHGSRRVITLPEGASTQVEILHDRSVTEVFFGDGALALCLRSFIAPDDDGVEITARGTVVLSQVSCARLD